MANYVEIAKSYVRAGYSVIPVSSNKMPSVKKWGKYQITPPTEAECEELFKSCWGFAVLCGGQGRLVAFDYDLKYSLNPYLWEEICELIPKEIFDKAYLQKTKNNGYHMVFRVPESCLKGNEKIACRAGTAEEKHIAYIEAYRNPETREKALKIAENTTFVLVENRSGSQSVSGGYYVSSPSPGYTKVGGKISELTEEEYNFLMEVLSSFNEVRVKDKSVKAYDNIDWEISPMDQYCIEGDVVTLLESHGWEVVRETNQCIDFKRPGSSPTLKSALYDKMTKIFTVFSTSTVFSTDRSYNHVGILGVLDYEEDYSAVYQYLLNEGWGIKKEDHI
jgi:hypothetical protein